jgi:V8-like Glu-specific endopeptidase
VAPAGGQGPHQARGSVGAPALALLEAARVSALSASLESVPGYQRKAPLWNRSPGATEAARSGGAPPTPDAAVGEFGTDETIIGDDDRVQVTPPSAPPWRFICGLRINFGGNNYVGTGWFIGPHTVMTAGHCVYMHGHGWATSIEVIPALDGSSRPFGSSTSSTFQAVDGWINDSNPDFDYGAIILPDDLGKRTGYFSFTALDDASLTSVQSNVAGYPADKGNSTMWYHSRRIARVSPTRLSYDIDTYGGQSGSPVWLNLGKRRYAVGIHTNGGTQFNSGTRITREIFDNMVRWKQ